MRTRTHQIVRPLAVALVCALAAAPALAHEPLSLAPPASLASSPELSAGLDGALPAAPLSPEDAALIQNALTYDPHRFDFDPPAAFARSPRFGSVPGLDIARTDRADGGSTVVLKQPLATEWDSKVGVDLALAGGVPTGDPLNNPFKMTRDDSGSGAAWASLNVPHFATVDARVDPANDTGRLGTKFTRSLPVGDNLAVSFESHYSLTETYGAPQAATPAVPLIAAPAGEAGEPVPHVFGNRNLARLNILPSGTILTAGLSSTSTDPVTHSSLSAEQKLYGPLRVTTAINDIGRESESKSIHARFKLNW